jgi:glycerol kinase
VKKKHILFIDQGSTGSRLILFNHEGETFTTSYKEIVQYFPYPGWVEHDSWGSGWKEAVKRSFDWGKISSG